MILFLITGHLSTEDFNHCHFFCDNVTKDADSATVGGSSHFVCRNLNSSVAARQH